MTSVEHRPWPQEFSRSSSPKKLDEIQALRAIAVAGVVLYHFAPSRLPGGFVGVDVFYVISGFLITGLIVASLERGTFGFRDFYTRRARRLLPAATLVLGVTALVVLALPYPRWIDTLEEILASLFYVQNWVLGLQGSDYFDNGPTAVQHYWSLSVEEQFYLAWPAALLALWSWQRRRGATGARAGILLGLAATSALSLVLSVVGTGTDPTLAFYATYTRVWEFGVGAALALLPKWTSTARLRALTSWAGLAVLLASMLLITSTSAFPGWIALFPVLATAGVIAAGSSGVAWSPDFGLRWRPVQWLGDISYSLYLWHWGPLVLLPVILGEPLSGQMKVLLLAACLGLAWITKVQVEDRFRVVSEAERQRLAQRGQHDSVVGRWLAKRTAGVIIAGMLVVATVSVAGLVYVNSRAASATAAEVRALDEGLACFGAAALQDPRCEPPLGEVIVPDPAVARQQFEQSPDQDCMVGITSDKVIVCEFGDPSGQVHVALLGDSHGLAWLPALQEVAREEGWRLTTYLRGSCPPNLAVTERPTTRRQQLCQRWSNEVIELVTADETVDLVVTTAKNNKSWVAEGDTSGYETAVTGYVSAWSAMTERGKRVLVLKDTPRSSEDVLDCLARSHPSNCSNPREVAVAADGLDDPQVAAVDRLNRRTVVLADPVDSICGSGTCEAVVGSVVVYVDYSHLSPTYARTLAPFLREAARDALS